MLLFFAGAGTSERIRPEDVLATVKSNTGTLLAFCEILNHKSSESSKRFHKIKKHRTVEKLR